MDKYIKESELFKRILNVDFKHDYDGCIKFCQSIPAADVVEVVRCEKCDNWNPMTHGCVRNPCVKPWWEDDYCSYWEEKEDE